MGYFPKWSRFSNFKKVHLGSICSNPGARFRNSKQTLIIHLNLVLNYLFRQKDTLLLLINQGKIAVLFVAQLSLHHCEIKKNAQNVPLKNKSIYYYYIIPEQSKKHKKSILLLLHLKKEKLILIKKDICNRSKTFNLHRRG